MQSDHWIRQIRVKLEVKEDFLPVRIFQSTVRLRSTIRGNCVLDLPDGMQICTSMEVMCHRDIQNQRVRRKTVVLSAWQDNVTLDLYVSALIAYRLCHFFTHLAKTEKHKIVDQSGQPQAQNVIWIPYSVLIASSNNGMST